MNFKNCVIKTVTDLYLGAPGEEKINGVPCTVGTVSQKASTIINYTKNMIFKYSYAGPSEDGGCYIYLMNSSGRYIQPTDDVEDPKWIVKCGSDVPYKFKYINNNIVTRKGYVWNLNGYNDLRTHMPTELKPNVVFKPETDISTPRFNIIDIDTDADIKALYAYREDTTRTRNSLMSRLDGKLGDLKTSLNDEYEGKLGDFKTSLNNDYEGKFKNFKKEIKDLIPDTPKSTSYGSPWYMKLLFWIAATLVVLFLMILLDKNLNLFNGFFNNMFYKSSGGVTGGSDESIDSYISRIVNE